MTAVVVLQRQHEVGVVDVVLDADGKAHLSERLLEIAARDSIGKDRERRTGTHGRSRWLPLTLAPLLTGALLVDIEPPPALAGATTATTATWKGRGLEG